MSGFRAFNLAGGFHGFFCVFDSRLYVFSCGGVEVGGL
jgi:hypothetical protein